MQITATMMQQRSEPPIREEVSEVSTPFVYPEFSGPGGERYLKKLLRQILPMALYRTWEIFIDHQARGNECYLGLSQLAAQAGRSLRTMQKNVAALQAAHLLVERVARKVFPGPDGDRTRLVIVKDFTALYALADDYHDWLQQEDMIPPERVFVSVILRNPDLVVRLQRFANYRRVFAHHVPSLETAEHEEDSCPLGSHPGALAQKNACQEETDLQDASPPFPPNMTTKVVAKDAAKTTPKRINKIPQKDETRKDSFDSAPSFSEESWRNEETEPGQRFNGDQDFTPGVLQPITRRFRHGRSKPRDEQDMQAATKPETRPIRSTMTTSPNQPGQRGDHLIQDGSTSPLRPPDHPLARSFLTEIAVPFGDRNPKGSFTRVLRILSQASCLEQAEVLLCLVRAATIARQTRTLRPEHQGSGAGQANRMPLFCTLVERFIQVRAQSGAWDYSWEQMEEDLAADARLQSWWAAQPFLHRDRREPSERWHPEEPSAPELQTPEVQSDERSGMWLSQTDTQREERTRVARRVLQRLSDLAVPIQAPILLWEHLRCGCPLYHQRKGKEVCVCCFPDPMWPVEVVALLHTIVETTKEGGTKPERTAACFSEVQVEAARDYSPMEKRVGWAEQAEAAAFGDRLLDAMTCNGYRVEVRLHCVGKWYQVVLKGGDGELVCERPEQIGFLIAHAENRTL